MGTVWELVPLLESGHVEKSHHIIYVEYFVAGSSPIMRLAYSDQRATCKGLSTGQDGSAPTATARVDEGPLHIYGNERITLFMGSIESNTAMWSLSWKAPESRATELNALFRDPQAAQVSG